ncbi:hypothetical protein SAMN05192544_104477 [Paraburkholderia hospita]|uniref:Uncharacterized protein n=1 Tax=Paraburkholderia hospita TaxID=169430 RepID=A0AAN1MR69_9BURK|nr:hypothetical protein C2L64_51000 [Paraburkholderia hospita]SEI22767.1 hypothetical protein SAMN05192544_104477 [Paraburkholderia hospita]
MAANCLKPSSSGDRNPESQPQSNAVEISVSASHIALDAMRRRQGNMNTAQTLCLAMMLTGLLAEVSYGIATTRFRDTMQ